MTNIVPQNFDFLANTIRNDGLINATALTAAYRNTTGVRKDVQVWLRSQEAKDSIAYLARATRILVADLVIVENGVGTWLHPDLAEILAQWISVEYRFAVVALIRQHKQGIVAPSPKPPTTRELALMVIAEADRADAAEARIEADSGYTLLGKEIESKSVNMTMRVFAIQLGCEGGRNTFMDKLREEKILVPPGTLPYGRYVKSGHLVVTRKLCANGKWAPSTLITPKGQIWLTKKWKQWQDQKITRLIDVKSEDLGNE